MVKWGFLDVNRCRFFDKNLKKLLAQNFLKPGFSWTFRARATEKKVLKFWYDGKVIFDTRENEYNCKLTQNTTLKTNFFSY